MTLHKGSVACGAYGAPHEGRCETLAARGAQLLEELRRATNPESLARHGVDRLVGVRDCGAQHSTAGTDALDDVARTFARNEPIGRGMGVRMEGGWGRGRGSKQLP